MSNIPKYWVRAKINLSSKDKVMRSSAKQASDFSFKMFAMTFFETKLMICKADSFPYPKMLCKERAC